MNHEFFGSSVHWFFGSADHQLSNATAYA